MSYDIPEDDLTADDMRDLFEVERLRVNHDKFLGFLAESVLVQREVGAWLHDQGEEVTLLPIRPELTRADVRERWDRGDGRISLRWEAKQRHFDFTSAADYPYPDFIVTACYIFDRAMPKIHVLYYLNERKTH